MHCSERNNAVISAAAAPFALSVLDVALLGGRALVPANNGAFEAALVPSVGDIANYLASAGYLSPTGDNSYAYSQTSASDPTISAAGITNTTP